MKKINEFINYAHRGASEYAPENTFLSFYLGVYMGANGIETDVQITKDNVLVLFHDDSLTRMTGQQGGISDYTFDELQSFWVEKQGLKDKIVKFEDFLVRFSKMDLTFAIELKASNVAKPVADMLKKFDICDKVVVTSFKYDELLSFRKVAPEYKTGYLTQDISAETLSKMKKDGISEFCPEAQFITKERVELWHELGFNVRAWGVYDQNLMRSAFFAGVDGMTVNFPDKLTELLKKEN